MTLLRKRSVMNGVSGVTLQGDAFDVTAVSLGMLTLVAIATLELLAATAVAAVASRVDSRIRRTLLPRRLRRLRDRVAPQPLDVFLAVTVGFVAVELSLSRPWVAGILAGLGLGALLVAVVVFRSMPSGGVDPGGLRTDRSRVVRDAIRESGAGIPGLEGREGCEREQRGRRSAGGDADRSD